MPSVKAYAALKPKQALEPYQFQRREPGPFDVEIDIQFCGVCHSDIHQAREEWGQAIFPMVPGHEIVGSVKRVGSRVTLFAPGQAVGVGCFVDSCRTCASCESKLEQYCEGGGMVSTYNGLERDKKTPTYGGYSKSIVVDENYVLRVPDGQNLAKVAPLLCAGITTYSPLKHWNVGQGSKVGIVGLGGLGHMAVQLAHAMGAQVTVLSTSAQKRADAKRLGADDFWLTEDTKLFQSRARSFDLILNTTSANIDLGAYMNLLQRDGTLVMLGVPSSASEIQAFSLIGGRRSLAGSLIGGIQETQEMLDFCASKKISSEVEVIPIKDINQAYERTIKGDVKFRFVIDMASLD